MDTAELKKEAIALRKEKHQMIKTALNADMKNGHDLAIVYTPGVSAPCLEIKKDEDLSLELTWRGNVVAVAYWAWATSVPLLPCLLWKANPHSTRDLAILMPSPSFLTPRTRMNSSIL